MYVRKTTIISGEVSLIQEHGPGRYGAPGQKRNKREKKTPEKVREQNRKNRAEKIQLLILANFQKGGHHIVLGYPKGEAPTSYEEAEKILKRFLEKIQRAYKGQFKYIAATERGKRTAVLHHHMIIQDAPGLLELIERQWPGKRVHSTPTYEDDTMGRQLADYIVKSIDKDEQGKYHISRNLQRPEVKRELIYGYMDEPKAPDGFQIVQDTLYTGVNAFTGWPYQRYFIRNLKTESPTRFTERNQGFWENLKLKFRQGAGKEHFNQDTKPACRKGNAASRIVDNSKSSNDAEKKYLEETLKPERRKGNAALQTDPSLWISKKSENIDFSEDGKKSRRKGNAASSLVDKLKAIFGAGKKGVKNE